MFFQEFENDQRLLAGWLLLSSCAYVLLEALRRLGLKSTELARAQIGTIRLKLLKIGAVITRNTRRVRIWFLQCLSAPRPLQVLPRLLLRVTLPMVLAPAPDKKWRLCPRCLPALKDHRKILLLVSLLGCTRLVTRTNAQNWKTMKYPG